VVDANETAGPAPAAAFSLHRTQVAPAALPPCDLNVRIVNVRQHLGEAL